MDDNKDSITEETRKFIEELNDNPWEKGTWQWRMREAQKAGAFDPNQASWEPPKGIRERLTEWVHLAPGYVLWLCKALKFILDVGGFLFMIGGGIAMLAAAWAVWKAWGSSGWRGLLDWNTANIIGYFAAMFIINKLRFLMFRIVEGR